MSRCDVCLDVGYYFDIDPDTSDPIKRYCPDCAKHKGPKKPLPKKDMEVVNLEPVGDSDYYGLFGSQGACIAFSLDGECLALYALSIGLDKYSIEPLATTNPHVIEDSQIILTSKPI